MAKLTDLCDIQYGYAFDSKYFSDDSSYPQLVRIRDVKRGFSETYYTGDFPKEYVLSSGDLLVGMDGEFNIARWKIDGALLNQRVCKIVAKPNICEEYLRFVLGKELRKIEERTSFVTVKHLSAKELSKLELEIPPYNRQVKIASILVKLEKIISKRQSEIEMFDTIIKARFVEMFGDNMENKRNFPIESLDVHANIVSGITKGRKTKELNLTEVPYMAVSNVKDGYIDWTTVKTILATSSEIEQYRLQTNDVLMTEGGDPDKLGRGALLTKVPENCIHQNHIFRVRLDSRVNPVYFEEYLQTARPKRYFLKAAKQTTGIASINMIQLRHMPLILPPMEEQKEFADFVHRVDKSKVAVQKALDETQTLFDSLMQEYFG